MNYKNIEEGVFLERLHRFGAIVRMGHGIEYVHVKNTGRCREILVPGVRVFLEKGNNPDRKTSYSLVSAYKGSMLINIDSQVPNEVVYNSLSKHAIDVFPKMKLLKREVSYRKSRFDIYYETFNGENGFIEIKGVTLDVDGTAMFPDAPTIRGRRHLIELSEAVKSGFKAHVFFLIQYKQANLFMPNRVTDPEFARALACAFKAGVSIHVYDCYVTESGIEIGKSVPYKID